MDEKKKPGALIVMDDQTSCASVKEVLIDSGWEVTCEPEVAAALEILETRHPVPFSLVITDFDVTQPNGAQVLETSEKLSPLTQRMMLTPQDRKDAVIKAINTAGIHACLFLPFRNEDLVSQADACYRAYVKTTKRQQYKRLIARQNHQLYEAGKNFKKKDETGKVLISEKKAEIVILKSQKGKLDRKKDLSTGITLKKFIDHKKTPLSPHAFAGEFMAVKARIDQLVETMVTDNGLEWALPDIKEVLNSDSQPFTPADLVETIKKYALIHCLEGPAGDPDPEPGAGRDSPDEETIDHYLELSVSEDRVLAHLKLKGNTLPEMVNLTGILNFLHLNHITYGITDDDEIETWLKHDGPDRGPIIIARGDAPKTSRDGEIEYLFKTDYTNPGKLLEDGSIDFKDRGDVPFVEKGNLLAKKTPPARGSAGMDIFGTQIPIEDPNDPPLTAGPGTVFSDDNLFVFADGNGQPHVDAMGSITVNQEIVIKGDVGFETGNINFEGNVVVKGTIKEGFSVKGVNLTAKEIDGAFIELTGDLNVSNGMTNTTITTVGNIHTKFINKCRILGFGNFTVLKEIIDSDLLLGGKCDISTGHIIASDISAKAGITAKNIGTVTSRPPILRVGFDDHISRLEEKNDALVHASMDKVAGLKSNIRSLKEKDKQLHETISEQAYIQDRSLVEIKQCRDQLPELEASGNISSFQKLTLTLEALKKKASKAEIQINRLFELQDSIGLEIEELTYQIHVLEEKNKGCVAEKKRLEVCKKAVKPDPSVSISRMITQGSRITAPNAVLVLKESLSRCTIREVQQEDGMIQFYEMQVINNTG